MAPIMTRKAAEDLKTSGLLTQEAFNQMIDEGKISSGVRKAAGPRSVMTAPSGINVVPSFYFGGGGKVGADNMTDEMAELKAKVLATISEYVHEESADEKEVQASLKAANAEPVDAFPED